MVLAYGPILAVARPLRRALGLGPGALESGLFLVLTGWALFAGIHALLAVWAYGSLAGDELRRALASPDQRDVPEDVHRRFLRVLVTGGGVPSWTIQLALLALCVSVVLGITPSLRQIPGILPSGIAVVATSWVSVVIEYALHYARIDQTRGGLEFPGVEERGFDDYLYQALAGQMTFGSTDVAVTTREMRRAVMTHALVAFAFNSVVVAILVSLLLSA